MTLARLQTRMTKLQVKWRPWVVADIVWRARQCAPSEGGAFLLAALTTVDRATASTIMDQLTEAELAALVGPEAGRFMETLSNAELEALARGDPATARQFQRAYAHWRKGTAHALTP